MINTDLLVRGWVHSHEEDAGGRIMFRPADFSFPPSRGRKGLHLKKGGECQQSQPGPTDRPECLTGTWAIQGEDILLILESGWVDRFKVVFLDENLLVLMRV